MADDKKQFGPEKENKADSLESGRIEQRQDEKEVRETKTSIGIEAGEIIESAEEPSGEVSESERKKKEGESGSVAGKASGQIPEIQKPKYPSVKKMAAQIEKELKKEIKDLQKKINLVMKKSGEFDPAHLNSLVARLRQLKEVLASLAYAAADAIKDLWHKYVK